MVPFTAARGIFDDDVHEKLRHQFLPFHFAEAVPGIRVFRIDQIKHTDRIALVTQVFAGFFVQFRFRVADDQGFPAGHPL